MNFLEEFLEKEKNEDIYNLYIKKDFEIQDIYKRKKSLSNSKSQQELDVLLDDCEDGIHNCNFLLNIIEKALFMKKFEIIKIKKQIRHQTMKNEANFDATYDKKGVSKTELQRLKKNFVDSNNLVLTDDLNDINVIYEYGEFELNRINRSKKEFEESTMNAKKKYQLIAF